MRTLTALTVLAALPALSACKTARATNLALPKERASECVAHCDTLGMKLSAVVIIMNAAGCVCEPKGAPSGSAPAGGAAAVSGGAAIVVAAAARQQQERQQSIQQPGSYHPGGPSMPGTAR